EDNWVINTCPHTGPAMTGSKEGLHFVWFTGGKKPGSYYAYSDTPGGNYRGHTPLSPSGAHPQLTLLPDGTLAIVWDESYRTGSQAFKRISIQKRTASGMASAPVFITPAETIAAYPVI